MANRRKPPSRDIDYHRTPPIGVRLTEGEVSWWDAYAEQTGQSRSAAIKDALGAFQAAHSEPNSQRQIQCCGVWTDYPTIGHNTQCPTCGSVFSVGESLPEAARGVLTAYQKYLDTDDLDQLRDALTALMDALGE